MRHLRAFESYSEGELSTFTHNDGEYFVDDIIDMTAKTDMYSSLIGWPFPICDLSWIFKFSKPEKSRVKSADMRYPIIITYSNSRWVVLDGLHRLAKAKMLGNKYINCIIVDENKLVKK